MIQAQIVYSKLHAIATELGERLRCSARSPRIAEDRAFATAVLTGDLRLAVQTQGEANHLFALRASVRSLFDYFAFDLAEGDVLAVADPYHGGTDSHTLTLAVPVFHGGDLVLFPAVRAPLIDLAGEFPGDLHPSAFEVWQESIRLTPLKLYRGGVRQKDVMRHLARNSRAPGVVLADIAAMVRACREAGEALSLLLGRHGRPAVEAAIDEVIGYTSRRVAAHLARLPAGRFAAEAQVPVAHEPPLTVRLALTNGNAGVVFDFAGTSAAVAAPFNATPEATAAFAALPLLAPLLDELAINDGLLEPFTIEAPEGTLVHPRFPSATGLSAHTTGHAIAHAVSAAMRAAGATPDLCPRLDGPGAVAALYPPIGTVAEMTARDLAPGFPRAADGFGPPALWGSRQLVSAEALEGSDRLRIIARERRAGGGMAVRVRILERAREANWLVPSSGPGGILRRGAAGETQALLATGLALAPGDELEFTYSGGGEGPDGEA